MQGQGACVDGDGRNLNLAAMQNGMQQLFRQLEPSSMHQLSSYILHYSWIGSRCQVGLMLAFGLSIFDFNSESRFGILTKKNYT